MGYDFELSTELAGTPEAVWDAWMSSDGHAAMTGAGAEVDARVGGTYSAGDGYITGVTLALERPHRIVQSWRTDEFEEEDPDSRIEVLLAPSATGTLLTLRHTNVPDDQRVYEEGGWEENYFEPMREYFAR
jgi:uncharacterized protein YndB with AHSA1/START domain